jgi:4-amino-4-deoxy-L-arabinose transferase-like glycosyltransferase
MSRLKHEHSSARWVLPVLATTLAVRLAMAARLELAPDEAYYWVWSRRLAAGYFDHPPAVAWMIAAGTALLGDTPLGVRSGAVLFGLASAWLVYRAVGLLTGDPSRARTLLLAVLVIPLGTVGGLLATPDAPLIFGWALALWGVARATRSEALNGAASWNRARLDDSRPAKGRALAQGRPGSADDAVGVWIGWLATGLGTGIACLSKYTGYLLLAALAAVHLLHPAYRSRLRGAGPWVALLVACVLAAPNLWWNGRQHGVSLAFQLAHGLEARGSGGGAGIVAFLAGQAAVVGPLIFWYSLEAWWHGARALLKSRSGDASEPGGQALPWALSAPVFLVFALASWRTRGEPSWPAPAYLAGLALISWTTPPGRRPVHALVSSGLITALIVIHALTGLLPLPARLDPTTQLHGWTALGRAVAARLAPGTVVVTDRYQEAAELAFHLGPAVTVTALPGRGRPDQYDLWETPVVPAGGDLLWVNRSGAGSRPPFGGFSRIDGPFRVEAGRAGQGPAYDVYHLRNAARAWPVHAGPGP